LRVIALYDTDQQKGHQQYPRKCYLLVRKTNHLM
jgi:hypothetical protein